MILNSKTIVIGSGAGKHNGALSIIVDSLFGVGTVSSVMTNTQCYELGFTQNKSTQSVDISAICTPPLSNGQTIIFNFENPLVLKQLADYETA